MAAALASLCASIRADAEAAPNEPAPEPPRREVVLALGYGSILAPQGISVYRNPETAERVAGFDGFSIDVTRRIARFELGARFWRMGDATHGYADSAHTLTRITTEARFYPWLFRTVEPWVGAELGLALADDFALWAATDEEPAHRVVAGVRPGLVAGAEAGARLRLASVLAVGMHGGLLFIGFDRAGSLVAESPQATTYTVRPTDYGERLWLSVGLTAELMVPD